MISRFFLRKERLCHIAGRHARHAVGRDYLSRRVFHFPRKCGKLLRMRKFEVVSPFAPSGDQGEAIDRLSAGFLRGDRFQTLKGVTGSGNRAWKARLPAGGGEVDRQRKNLDGGRGFAEIPLEHALRCNRWAIFAGNQSCASLYTLRAETPMRCR